MLCVKLVIKSTDARTVMPNCRGVGESRIYSKRAKKVPRLDLSLSLASQCKKITCARKRCKVLSRRGTSQQISKSKFWKSNKKIVWYISLNKLNNVNLLHSPFFHIGFVLYKIKISTTIFLAMKINTFLTSTRQNSSNWRRNELKIQP